MTKNLSGEQDGGGRQKKTEIGNAGSLGVYSGYKTPKVGHELAKLRTDAYWHR